MGRTKKRWSYSAGERGRNRVRVFEDARSWSILMEVYEDGNRIRTALGHQDCDRAKQEADEAAAQFDSVGKLQFENLRVGPLFEKYLGEVTPNKTPHKQKHDRRASRMFAEFFGQNRTVESLNRRDWDRFLSARSRGDITGRTVRPRTVEYDLRFLLAVLRWATQTRAPDGGFLLQVNPLRGLPVPKEPSPKRPIVKDEQYRALLEKAGEIDWRFYLALALAHETGHRIGAIRQLKWSDIDLHARRVRWRGDTDKQGRDHATPLSTVAAEALRSARRVQPRLGAAWVFPAPGDAQEPCSRHIMRDWWKRGEVLAGLEPVERRGWHSLRRKFATDMRTRLPLRDLCAAGGWNDPQTVLKCYQQPDEDLIRGALDDRGGQNHVPNRQDNRQEDLA